MPKLRTLVWLFYVPFTLGLTWLLMRLVIALAELVTIGRVDTLAMASDLALKALPYAGVAAVAMYLGSLLFLALKKRSAFVVCGEIASISAAKAIGLAAVVVNARGDGFRSWFFLAIMGFSWLIIERRGAWPWRRALRMLLLAVGVFLVVQNAAHL